MLRHIPDDLYPRYDPAARIPEGGCSNLDVAILHLRRGNLFNLVNEPVPVAHGYRALRADPVPAGVGLIAISAGKITPHQLLVLLVLVEDPEIGILDAHAVADGGNDRFRPGPLLLRFQRGGVECLRQAIPAPDDTIYITDEKQAETGKKEAFPKVVEGGR